MSSCEPPATPRLLRQVTSLETQLREARATLELAQANRTKAMADLRAADKQVLASMRGLADDLRASMIADDFLHKTDSVVHTMPVKSTAGAGTENCSGFSL